MELKERTFDSQEIKLIKIGRSKDAEVICKDESVSRIHCTIHFEDSSWVLYDGLKEHQNKISTNGTW